MKLKRMALKGLIYLAVGVALCMFFGRTVQTITTPKVQIVEASRGRFEEKMTFQAQVYFGKTEKMVLEAATRLKVSIRDVYVKPGHYVKKGETILTCEAVGYEEEMDKLQQEYDKKARELMDLDIANRKLSKESRQNNLYDLMVGKRNKMSRAALDARLLALADGVKLVGQVVEWESQLALAGEVSAETAEAVAAAVTAQKAWEAASEDFYEVMEDRKLRVKDNVFKYINDRNALAAEMEKITADMVNLNGDMQALKTVTAPWDGYIAAVEVKAGDAYDGTKAAYVISAEGEKPILRAAMTGNERSIADETKAEIRNEIYGTAKTAVTETVTETEGGKYLCLAMPEEYLQAASAIRRMVADGGVEAVITYRAKESTTLLPPSAVRSDGEDAAFVYVIEYTGGGFMDAMGMKIVKTPVTIVEKSGKMVSVREDLAYQRLADREDRALTDGQRVMEYIK